MFSLSPDEDEGDFASPIGGGSSKLASLFGQDRASFSGGNESLTYTAPKQPKKEKPGASQSSSGETTLLCAAAVHAYKYVNGQYASQGKLGAAVLANHPVNDYRILLYVSKQQQVTTGKVHGNFSLTVQGNNYVSFYDDQRQTWSLCFDSEENVTNFAKQVGLSKFNSSPSTLCTQDLTPGDGMAVELGDAVEVKYTGWFWTNNSFGKVFDSNNETDKTFKFKTGKGKVIKGWEQGVIGMKKGGKRLIGIPSALAYGEKGVPSRIPPNSSLLFVVDVLRIKSNRDSVESPVTIQDTASVQNTEQLPDILSEPSGTRKRSSDSVSSQLSVPSDAGIKERTASLNEQLSQSPGRGTDKARLIARMSKMGKNPLSLPGAVAADPESFELDDAEQEVPSNEAQPALNRTEVPSPSPPPISNNPHPSPRSKPQPPPRPSPVQVQYEVHRPVQNPAPAPQPIQQPVINAQPIMSTAFTPQHQVALYQAPQQAMSMGYPMMPQQPQVFTQPIISPPQPPPAPPPQSTASDAMVPVLMAETRQQQGEVRMAIGKLSDKIDELSNKVERHHLTTSQLGGQISPAGPMGVGLGAFGNSQAVMEASVLVHNITRIVQENEKLKADGAEKAKKIEVLNDKISELLQKSQRFVEHSNTMLEQRSDSLQLNSAQSQARVLSLEQERISMSGELTTAKTHLAALQNEVTTLRQREAELTSQLSRATSDAEKYKNELAHAKDSHTESAEQTDKLKHNLKEEKQTRKRLESKVDHIEEELNDLKHEKDSLEKSLAERKKKHTTDKKKFEEELEELRSQQEEEIKFLKEKHRKEKQSSGTVTAQQVSQAEAELEARWTEKAEKMVAQSDEKWKRRFQEVLDEKEEANRKLLELQEKYSSLKSSDDVKEEKIKDLQDKVEDLETVKEKYTRLQASQSDKDSEIQKLQSAQQELNALQAKYQEIRSRTVKMKEQYEEQITSAEEEHESALAEAYAKGLTEGKQQAATLKEQGPTNVADEVKRIMNTVFYMLKGEFNSGESYTGSQIMAVILKTIKEVTMKLVAGKSVQKDESEEEEEDEEDEEEEEEAEDEKEGREDEQEAAAVNEKAAVQEKKVEEDQKGDEEQDEEAVETNTAEEDALSKTAEDNKKDNTEDKDSVVKTEQIEETSENNKDSDINVSEIDGREESQENSKKSGEESSEENQIDIPSLEELSAETQENNSEITIIEADESGPEAPTIEDSDNEAADGKTEPSNEVVAEEKEEQQESQGEEIQSDTTRKDSTQEDKFKSLFGDDDHDDVEATFGSLTKKKEEKTSESPPPREVPPPLFDDDDDDDLDWFK